MFSSFRNFFRAGTILLFSCAIYLNASGPEKQFYSESQNKALNSKESLQNKILWINHINLVVTKILTYNDKLILTLEYEKLVDSINYNNLPQGPLRTAIKELIQALKVLSDSWDEKEFAKKEYMRSCDKAFQKAAIDIGKKGFSATKSAVMFNYRDAIYQTADVAASFLSYQEMNEQMESQHERRMRAIAKEDARHIHELRNRVWDIFSNEFNSSSLQDQDRVSIQDCKSFMNILKNGSPSGQYAVLSGVNNQTRFRSLPVFWYYLGYTACKLNKNDEAMAYLARFKKIYRNLFRYDIYATNALILETKILIQNPAANKARILANLDELVKNIENRDWKSRYFAALCYFQLKDPETAVKLLRQNIEYLNIQTREASTTPARNLFGDPNIPMELLPDGESLAMNRRLLNMNELHDAGKTDKILHDLMNDFAVSSFEKAQYLGAISKSDFFRLIEKDVRGISLKVNQRAIKPYVELEVPAPWFYISQKPALSLEFYDSNRKKTASLENTYSASGWNAKTHSVILSFPLDPVIEFPDQAAEVLLSIRANGLVLHIRYHILKQKIKEAADAKTNWEKLRQWSEKKIKQGKDAWSRIYKYRQVELMIGDASFPLSAP